jgi:hypothetical protein
MRPLRKRTASRERDYKGNINILKNNYDKPLDAFEKNKGRSLSPIRFIHYQATVEDVKL